MSFSTISIDQLTSEVNKLLEDYTDEVSENVNQAIEETAEESKKKIRRFTVGRKKWKKYPKGWKVNLNVERYKVSATVYNSSHYQLTHLLEKGHATRDGGRTAAFPHIADVNNFAQELVMRKIKEKLS